MPAVVDSKGKKKPVFASGSRASIRGSQSWRMRRISFDYRPSADIEAGSAPGRHVSFDEEKGVWRRLAVITVVLALAALIVQLGRGVL